MRKSLVLWLFWMLCAFAAHIRDASMLTFFLLIALLLIPACTFIMSAIAVKKVRVHISAPFIMQKNRKDACVISFSNKSRLPVWHLKCKLSVSNHLTGEDSFSIIETALLPRGKKDIPLRLESSHCGHLRVKVEALSASGVLLEIAVFGKSNAASKTTVFPDTFPSGVYISLNSARLEDTDEYSSISPGWDKTETFQIRDYVMGDDIKQIHWKLTTKYDRLIVRDPALPQFRSLLLFWDKSLPAGFRSEPSSCDALGEAFVSVCQSLISQSLTFHVACNDPQTDTIELLEIRSLSDLSEAVSMIFAVRSALGGLPAPKLYSRLMERRAFSTIAYFTEHVPDSILDIAGQSAVTILLCRDQDDAPAYDGLQILAFSARDYKEVLYEIAL